MTAALVAHPTASALTALESSRVTRSDGEPLISVARGRLSPDWSNTAALFADSAALRSLVLGYGAWLGTSNPQVASALAFKAYTYRVIEPAITLWATSRRVIDMDAKLTMVSSVERGFDIAVTEERLTVLAGDPFAGLSGVTVVESEQQLLDALRATLVDAHLAPAVEAFRAIRGGGTRPLWGSVAQSICYPATVLGDRLVGAPEDAIADLLSIFDPSIAGLVEIAEISEGDQWRPLLLRRTCCFAYKLPQFGYCATCCLATDSDRDDYAAERGVQWRRTTKGPAS